MIQDSTISCRNSFPAKHDGVYPDLCGPAGNTYELLVAATGPSQAKVLVLERESVMWGGGLPHFICNRVNLRDVWGIKTGLRRERFLKLIRGHDS